MCTRALAAALQNPYFRGFRLFCFVIINCFHAYSTQFFIALRQKVGPYALPFCCSLQDLSWRQVQHSSPACKLQSHLPFTQTLDYSLIFAACVCICHLHGARVLVLSLNLAASVSKGEREHCANEKENANLRYLSFYLWSSCDLLVIKGAYPAMTSSRQPLENAPKT